MSALFCSQSQVTFRHKKGSDHVVVQCGGRERGSIGSQATQQLRFVAFASCFSSAVFAEALVTFIIAHKVRCFFICAVLLLTEDLVVVFS